LTATLGNKSLLCALSGDAWRFCAANMSPGVGAPNEFLFQTASTADASLWYEATAISVAYGDEIRPCVERPYAFDRFLCLPYFQRYKPDWANRWTQQTASAMRIEPVELEVPMRVAPTVEVTARRWGVADVIPCKTTAWAHQFFVTRDDGQNFEAGATYFLNWTANAEI
jgi:hypothetical protein